MERKKPSKQASKQEKEKRQRERTIDILWVMIPNKSNVNQRHPSKANGTNSSID